MGRSSFIAMRGVRPSALSMPSAGPWLTSTRLDPKQHKRTARGGALSPPSTTQMSMALLQFQAVRFEPKGLAQRRPDGKGGWVWSLADVRHVPYRLPELLAANPAAWVLIVEGEKDVDRLTALGFVATTNAGGAGKWRPELSRPLLWPPRLHPVGQ